MNSFKHLPRLARNCELPLVTDIYGEETRTDSSAINLTESPIFVESR